MRRFVGLLIFFFNDTATTEIYTLSLHDALPIWRGLRLPRPQRRGQVHDRPDADDAPAPHERHREGRGLRHSEGGFSGRSEEHTSELQSRQYLVCRLLLEKKNNMTGSHI